SDSWGVIIATPPYRIRFDQPFPLRCPSQITNISLNIFFVGQISRPRVCFNTAVIHWTIPVLLKNDLTYRIRTAHAAQPPGALEEWLRAYGHWPPTPLHKPPKTLSHPSV